MSKIILQGDQIISYDLTRKKVKNINIRVKSDLTVQVSAPSRISQSEIEKILMEKSDFILSALQKYEQRLEAAEALAKDGNGNEYVTILGTLFPIRVISGKKNKAEICENEVLVTLKDINDIAYVRFASVYRRFQDVSSFIDELEALIRNKPMGDN